MLEILTPEEAETTPLSVRPFRRLRQIDQHLDQMHTASGMGIEIWNGFARFQRHTLVLAAIGIKECIEGSNNTVIIWRNNPHGPIETLRK